MYFQKNTYQLLVYFFVFIIYWTSHVIELGIMLLVVPELLVFWTQPFACYDGNLFKSWRDLEKNQSRDL